MPVRQTTMQTILRSWFSVQQRTTVTELYRNAIMSTKTLKNPHLTCVDATRILPLRPIIVDTLVETGPSPRILRCAAHHLVLKKLRSLMI